MTKLSDYDQGRIDVIFEIFKAAEDGNDIHDKMNHLLNKCISIVKKFNDEHVRGAAKK